MPAQWGKQGGDLHHDAERGEEDVRGLQCCEGSDGRARGFGLREGYFDGYRV